ncbi:MAG TPA: PBP1A family penicillin-binding protein [Candidatus Kapabacteria bacterium]|nr:PBP1A family penicillin-binding protein [Candidatus Kapabacteria bacterium]
MKGTIKFLIFLSTLVIILMIALAIYVNLVISSGMPSLEQLENPKTNLATKIYSADGIVIDHFFKERRVNLRYNEIPKDFINALIATEDKDFYSHYGIQLERIFKAAIKNIFLGDREGASTITQQLSRNLFLNQAYNLDRKIREAFLALQIERTYTKQEILEMYINTVSYGRGAYGLVIASQVYFDKDPEELTTAECALLVALLKAPSNYNPTTNYDRAISRRNLVLTLMNNQDLLDADKYSSSIQEPILVYSSKNKQERKNIYLGLGIAPHFVEMIRQDLGKSVTLSGYDLYRDGLSINTTLDTRIQKYLNEAVEEHINELQASFDKAWNWRNRGDLLKSLITRAIKDLPAYRSGDEAERSKITSSKNNDKHFIDSVKRVATTIQVGVVVINPINGAILAMVGSSPKAIEMTYGGKYSLNHATQILRQPGSSFKPFVYATALNMGLVPTSMIECGPYTVTLGTGETWSPSGSGGCAPGEKVTLIDGLRLSINTVAARLVTTICQPIDVLNLARKMGISSPLTAVPAISLGAGGDVSPLEMTSAYCTFAFNGWHVAPYYYSLVKDKNDVIIYQKPPTMNFTEALSPEIATQITYMLEQVVNAGTASRAVRSVFKGVDAAGKTGTTNDAADAWFVGYTPQLVAGVWVGFDNKKINFNVLGAEGYGGRAAAPLWAKLMNKIYSDISLPYKQKTFSYKMKKDTLSVDNSIYPLTDKQKNHNPSATQTEEQALPVIPLR